MIGETLNGRYYILSLLGTGRCGQTYLGEDCHTKGKPRCVIKQFEPEAKDTLSLRKAKYLFAREVKILKILGRSDRIPDLLDYFRQGEKFYLVHQFIEGTDLAKELGAGCQWSDPQVLALLKEILEIVEVAHAEKVIHQDIKPSNIVRRQSDDKLMLIDFGSVKKINNQMANAEGNTSITVPIGTRGYMSPEQKSIRPRLASDIYAVGTIGIYALTGVDPKDIPLERETEAVLWHDLAQVEPRFAKILDRMVCPDFTKRYSSASEALNAINNFKFSGKLWDWKTAIGASAILLAISGVGYYYWRLESSLAPPPEMKSFEEDSTQFSFLYRNDANGVEMKYPADWKIAQPMQERGVIVKLTPDNSDAIAPEVSLEVEPTSEASLERYTTETVYQITKLPQAKIIDSYPTDFAGEPGHKIIYTTVNKDSNVEQKYLQIWTLKGDRAYTATYRAAIDNYSGFAKTVEDRIFETIKID